MQIKIKTTTFVLLNNQKQNIMTTYTLINGTKCYDEFDYDYAILNSRDEFAILSLQFSALQLEFDSNPNAKTAKILSDCRVKHIALKYFAELKTSDEQIEILELAIINTKKKLQNLSGMAAKFAVQLISTNTAKLERLKA